MILTFSLEVKTVKGWVKSLEIVGKGLVEGFDVLLFLVVYLSTHAAMESTILVSFIGDNPVPNLRKKKLYRVTQYRMWNFYNYGKNLRKGPNWISPIVNIPNENFEHVWKYCIRLFSMKKKIPFALGRRYYYILLHTKYMYI